MPSPRDLPEFSMSTDFLIDYDKLWVKYYSEPVAYLIGREYFLKHEEYTHLIILPDDLVVYREHLKMLLEHDLPVVSGWCNWDSETGLSTFTQSSPPDPPITGTLEDYKFYTIDYVRMLSKTIRLHEVKFTSFAPVVLERPIVRLVPFRWDHCCIDSCFSLDLAKTGIKQYVDLAVETFHLKTKESPDWYSNLQVGKKKAYTRLEVCQ